MAHAQPKRQTTYRLGKAVMPNRVTLSSGWLIDRNPALAVTLLLPISQPLQLACRFFHPYAQAFHGLRH